MRLGPIGQDEVAIGLESGGSCRVRPNLEKAAEHRLGLIFDRTLQEHVRPRVLAVMVDNDSIVEYLPVIAWLLWKVWKVEKRNTPGTT